MNQQIIDAHIHLDLYKTEDREVILHDLDKYSINSLISVSKNYQSSLANLKLYENNNKVKPAIGFHPEQSLPSEEELGDLLQLLENKHDQIVAVGEVGLPYYVKQEKKQLPLKPYMELLEAFIVQAAKLDKPIILHAIYEHTAIVCDLLEKHTIKKAHFHWYKGDKKSIERLARNGYFVSITPDIFYKERTEKLVRQFPIEQLMVETDGPWPFVGIFTSKMTHPKMIHQTMRKIACIKRLNLLETYELLFNNTQAFFNLDSF
ncbi:TatD family hydrolase [Bacillus kwashiorkori]|uniref:TatD family hydrolase n=1 Tax=Bacillus kwashiorkori TaxID=1522318 RepID=UPI0007851B12|nr:TatD family hydrolase [Bacillus kwashiorkori]